ncbi:MAG: heme-copper oxidase subunit III [Anaerolineae bacterium]|nr:heme-copper oxidase subunit III [Anaerolineae bacterium]
MSEMSLEKAPAASVEAAHGHEHNPGARSENLKFATWLYLASEVVIFATMIGVFIVFRFHNPEIVQRVHKETNILLVTLNTFLLLTSSWAMVMGLREIQRDNRQGLIRWFGLMCILGTVFVGLQYVEYQELAHIGVALFNQGNEFDGFGMRFYAPTAFHGVHVIIGVLWGLFVMNNARKGNYSSTNYAGVEVFGLYWHFVDVVWIILFTMLYLV